MSLPPPRVWGGVTWEFLQAYKDRASATRILANFQAQQTWLIVCEEGRLAVVLRVWLCKRGDWSFFPFLSFLKKPTLCRPALSKFWQQHPCKMPTAMLGLLHLRDLSSCFWQPGDVFKGAKLGADTALGKWFTTAIVCILVLSEVWMGAFCAAAALGHSPMWKCCRGFLQSSVFIQGVEWCVVFVRAIAGIWISCCMDLGCFTFHV